MQIFKDRIEVGFRLFLKVNCKIQILENELPETEAVNDDKQPRNESKSGSEVDIGCHGKLKRYVENNKFKHCICV